MPQGDETIGVFPPEIDDAPNIYEFNRCETPKQTPADALRQAASMEIWGLDLFGGNAPTVQAYREKQLPLALNGGRGIMFDSVPPPTPSTGSPFEARWRLGSPGVFARPGGYAAISIKSFLNLQP